MRTPGFLAVCALVFGAGLATSAAAQQKAAAYPAPASFDAFLISDRAAEIALARSAAPASISDDAEIRTLGPKGFEVAIKGKNGFICLVDRSWAKPFDDAEFWNPKVRSPMCLNAVAARSVLPIFDQRARWVMTGVSKAEVERRTRAALAAKALPTPEPGTFVYMMSKQGYLADSAAPHWHAHVMVYLPLAAHTDWGAGKPGSPVNQADDDAIGVSTLFILVPKWSDGSSALMEMP
jgi:hypothetical protein